MIRERALVAKKHISDRENQKHRGVPTLQVSLDNADVVIDRMTIRRAGGGVDGFDQGQAAAGFWAAADWVGIGGYGVEEIF